MVIVSIVKLTECVEALVEIARQRRRVVVSQTRTIETECVIFIEGKVCNFLDKVSCCR